MRWIRHTFIVLTLSVGALFLVACQGGGSDTFEWQPVYGNGGFDESPVVARVGDIEITQKDLDLRYGEFPDASKGRYGGEDGMRLLLSEMVNETLLTLGAVEENLYKVLDVRQSLITGRRMTLSRAMRAISVVGDKVPSEEQMQEYFQLNRSDFQILGRVHLNHIECTTLEDATAAYERLQSTNYEDDFAHVAADYSVNEKTRETDGTLGWVNENSYVPYVPNSVEFSQTAFNMPPGINKPVQVGDRWHVIEVVNKVKGRPMTFQEARSSVVEAMRPGFQDQLTIDWLDEARERYGVSIHGRFAPGGGLDVEQIFARAMTVPSDNRKYDMFMMIANEYPDSDRADDALYWGALAAMDAFTDRVLAVNLLSQLCEHYPDSEYVEDARYIVDNAYDDAVWNPTGPEGSD